MAAKKKTADRADIVRQRDEARRLAWMWRCAALNSSELNRSRFSWEAKQLTRAEMQSWELGRLEKGVPKHD